jgi:hypothetical protein
MSGHAGISDIYILPRIRQSKIKYRTEIIFILEEEGLWGRDFGIRSRRLYRDCEIHTSMIMKESHPLGHNTVFSVRKSTDVSEKHVISILMIEE